MTKWQRRARLLIAVFAIAFAVAVVFAFKRRSAVASPASAGRTDPNAIVESTSGRVVRFKATREDVTVEFEKQLTYQDGSTKLLGVNVVSTARNGRVFTVSGKEGLVGRNESEITLHGDVRLASSDGMTARTEHAVFSENDGMMRAPGPVEFSRKRLYGSGIGMTYDKNQDILVILDQASVKVMADAKGNGATDITAPTATMARLEKVVRFERGLKAMRGGQIIEADNGLARLTDDEEHLQAVELRGNSRITGSNTAAAGSLQALTGRDMDLTYAPDGETLQHALIVGDAILQLAGQKGGAGRQISANILDLTLAPDGTTPTALVGKESVELKFPAEPGGSGARSIKAMSLEASGDPKRGLTGAVFTGEVQYREQLANSGRAANSGALEIVLKPGMSAIEEAKFSKAVRFEEGNMGATAAAARYLLDKGTLDLSGTEPGAPRPHIVADQIAVDANRVDVTLAGPVIKATGQVRSVLKPKPKDEKSDSKMPSMLKADQSVNIIGDDLDYDGTKSSAQYRGSAKLWQGDTSVQGQNVTLDSKNGDLIATGSVTTTAMLEQTDKTKKKTKVRSIGKARDFRYEESNRRATYTGDAHLSGPQGDMTAEKIELYLKQSGDEIDRAEAYDKLTLREQNRKTTGTRLTYTTSDERYVITGLPVSIVDECGRETVGKTLVFTQATDTVTVDGGGQARTQTRGAGKCS